MNKDVVGKSCREIGAMGGIDIPANVRTILLPAKGAGAEDVLAKEKLCPVVAILPYQDFREAVAKAKANLLVEGAGHSAAVHSNNEANIRDAGLELPVSRLVVNQACSFTAGGSLTNGFAPTTTYEMVVHGRTYPPKAILGVAYEIATGSRLASADFEGGRSGAVKVLSALGFTVRQKHRPRG